MRSVLPERYVATGRAISRAHNVRVLFLIVTEAHQLLAENAKRARDFVIPPTNAKTNCPRRLTWTRQWNLLNFTLNLVLEKPV
jgi:hypothetical protein